MLVSLSQGYVIRPVRLSVTKEASPRWMRTIFSRVRGPADEVDSGDDRVRARGKSIFELAAM